MGPIQLKVTNENEEKMISKKLDFSVPTNVQSISLCIDGIDRIWGTLLIYDEAKNLRAQYVTGKAPLPIIIHEQSKYTSPYAVAGRIIPGTWTIELLGVMKDRAEDIRLKVVFNTEELKENNDNQWIENVQPKLQLSSKYNERIVQKESKWYKGDFHTHTIYSDGQMTREENMDSAKNQQLDFFVATDHNVIPTSWVQDESVLVIPGVEVTAPNGHFNILNLNTSPFINNHLTDMLNEKGMNRIIEDEYGDALISINHPFLTEWKWLFNETELCNVDTLEIWNDPTYADNVWATEQALKAWDLLLQDGHKITGIGGSDSHLRPEDCYEGSEKPSLIGDPGTFVYAEGLSIKNIIQSVKNGHVYVSRGERINFTCGPNIAGDTCTQLKGEMKVEVQESNEQLTFEWIIDGKIVKSDVGIQSVFTFNFDDTYHYVRINVRSEDGTLYGFTNPIYFKEKQPSLTTWGQLLSRLMGEKND